MDRKQTCTKYSCQLCPKQFLKQQCLLEHTLAAHRRRNNRSNTAQRSLLGCRCCGYRFTAGSAVVPKCTNCGHQLRKRIAPKTSSSASRQALTLFRCDDCSKSFGFTSQLRKHRRFQNQQQTDVSRKEYLLNIPADSEQCTITVEHDGSNHDGEITMMVEYLDEDEVADLGPYTVIPIEDFATEIHDDDGNSDSTLDRSVAANIDADNSKPPQTNATTTSSVPSSSLLCPDCPRHFKYPTALHRHRMRMHNQLPPSTEASSNTSTAHKTPVSLQPLHTAHSVLPREDSATLQLIDALNAKPVLISARLPSERPGHSYTFQCPRCPRRFTSSAMLRQHRLADCGRRPPHACADCGKAFHSAGSLRSHRSVHTGELPFGCGHCAKRFRTSGQVRVHERQHTGEQPYGCEHCPKRFAYRESMLTHATVHDAALKRFWCAACGQRYSCIRNLLAHRKTRPATCGRVAMVTVPLADKEETELEE